MSHLPNLTAMTVAMIVAVTLQIIAIIAMIFARFALDKAFSAFEELRKANQALAFAACVPDHFPDATLNLTAASPRESSLANSSSCSDVMDTPSG